MALFNKPSQSQCQRLDPLADRVPSVRRSGEVANGTPGGAPGLRDAGAERVWIQFELCNYLEHQHERKGCDTGVPEERALCTPWGRDIIICWEHNWPECPEGIELIELSKLVGLSGEIGDRASPNPARNPSRLHLQH